MQLWENTRQFVRKYAFLIYYSIKKRLIGQDPEEVFTQIYEKNLWGNPESVSGDGSTIRYTENIRRRIPELVQELSISKILDAPCGDHSWFNEIRFEGPVHYVGADIVKDLIEANEVKYSSPAKRFIQCNIIKDNLAAADLWLCRDALFHFSDNDIFLTLNNFVNSEIEYLLTSSHTDCEANRDIYTGSFRLLNLELPPFNFPPPIRSFDDWIDGFPVRKLCLWDRQTITAALERNSNFLEAINKPV